MTRRPRPRPARGAVSGVANVLLTVAAAGGVLCIVLLIAAVFFQISLVMFRTGSMSPTIPAGALAIAREVPASSVDIGDVVTVDRGPDQLPITHRVIAAEDLGDGLVSLTLQGDANPSPDPAPYQVRSVRLILWSVPDLAVIVAGLSSAPSLAVTSVLVAGLVTWAFWPHGESDRESTRGRRAAGSRARLTEPRERVRAAESRVRVDRGRDLVRGRRAAPPVRARRRADTARPVPRRRRPAHRLDRRMLRFSALAGIPLALVLLPTALPAAPASAAVIEETVTSDHLTLTSIRDPEAMTSMLPGIPVDWQVGVRASAPAPGLVELTLHVTGTLAADENGLWLDLRTCRVRWVGGVCSTGARTISPAVPASDLVGTTYRLGLMPVTEEAWILLTATIPPSPSTAPSGYADLQVTARAGDELVTADGSGVTAMPNTGAPAGAAFAIGFGAIGAGLALALVARLVRRRAS